MVQAIARQADPVGLVLDDDKLRDAVDLEGILGALEGLTESNVKIMLHKIEGSKEPWIQTLSPDVEIDELNATLREEYGAGDYVVKIMVNGKYKTQKRFSIAAPKALTQRPLMDRERGGGNSEMMLALARMQQESADKQTTMLIAMMQDSRAAAERSNQATIGLITAIIPALAGGKAMDPIATMASMAETMKALQPPPVPAGTMKEAIETLAALRDLTEGGGGGGEGMDGLLGLANKAIPLFGQIIDQAQRNSAGGAPGVAPALTAPESAIAAPVYAAAPGIPDTAGHRLIARIRDDVAYLLKRRHDPELAADTLYDVLVKEGVGQDDLSAAVTEFSASPDWPGELAKHGLQLAGQDDILWLNQVISGLVGLFAQDSQSVEHGPAGQGAGGSGPNLSHNGRARPAGVV